MDIPFYKTGEYPEILVILDNRKEDMLKQFRCPMCGKVLFEYYTNLKIIMSGGLNGEEIKKRCKSPIVIQCKGAMRSNEDGQNINTVCKARFWVE